MDTAKQAWLDMLGIPPEYMSSGRMTPAEAFSYDGLRVELYCQETCEGKHRRVMMVFPKEENFPAPAVAVPFYFPEAMLGYDHGSGEVLERYRGIEMLLHLAHRGYVVASADAYHLTYIQSDKERTDFSRWQDAADALHSDYPDFAGIGKLFCDTRLLIDALAADPRVDGERIGIAGHSLGGKMAFYTGCLDGRIRAILASDFGMCWDQSNWDADWYWGEKLPRLAEMGMDNAALLGASGGTPFCLIAGQYDDERSYRMMQRAAGYEAEDARLGFINHATGHRPPMWALLEGYEFLDRYLKG